VEFIVEFFGLPRRLSGIKETTVQVKKDATLRDITKELASQFPAFLGPLIDPVSFDIEQPYFFNIDARHVPKSLEHIPRSGERLLLLFLEAGG